MQYTEIFQVVKIENFHQKENNIFLIFAQNIGCGYTLEPPQPMFWSKNKKNRYTPVNLSFARSKWGMRVYILHGHVFLMGCNDYRNVV